MSRFEEWLRSAHLDIEVRSFAQGTRTAEDAARAIGCEVGQIVKSLVFTAGGAPIVALVSGSNRVDTGKLAEVAGGPVGKADADTARSAAGRPDAVFPIRPSRLRELSGGIVADLS